MDFFSQRQGYMEKKTQWLKDALSGKTVDKIFLKNNSEEEELRENSYNTPIGVMSPWSLLVQLAEKDQNLPELTQNSSSNEPFQDRILDTALMKCVRDIVVNEQIDRNSAQREILKAWKRDRFANTSKMRTVRFFRDLQESTFTECNECGHENDFGWEVCEHCGSTP